MKRPSLNTFLQPLRIPRFAAYLLAVVLSLGVYWVKIQLSAIFDIQSPFLLGEIIIILCALFAGTGPAILAAFITALGAEYFFMDPQYSFQIGVDQGIQLGVYVLQNFLVILLINRMQLNSRNLLNAKDELEFRVQERTKEVETANEELRRSNRELEDFAHVASHDLQEPLRKIQTFSQLILDELENSVSQTARSNLQVLQKSAERMRRLIEDLLAFSRVSMRAQQFAPVDLNLILEDVLHDLDVRVKELDAEITIDRLPTIEADPTQMQQLFQNLLSNALKFHREEAPPQIRIRTFTSAEDHEKINSNSDSPRYVHVSVADNGIGFDAAYKDKVFEMFERLHGRSGFSGTGIGLAVCKKIVERHGGTISVESNTGKGTTFLITLLLKAQP